MLGLQMCTEEIWQGTMEQITKLGIQPAELPEEALTQIYQVRQAPKHCTGDLYQGDCFPRSTESLVKSDSRSLARAVFQA